MRIVSAHKYYFDRDGASHYQLEVNRLLEAAGHEVIPFAMQHEKNLATPWSKYFVSPVQTREVRHGLSALRTFGRMLYGWEARENMRRLLGEVKPDVVHLHNIYTQISPSILDAVGEARIPAVMTVHDYHLVSPNYMLWKNGAHANVRDWGLWRAATSRFHKDSMAASFAQALSYKLHHGLRLYDRHISRFICPSAFVREQMELAGYASEKLVVLPHFIDVAGKKPVWKGDGSVLFVGRFVEEKGIRFLLDLAGGMPETKFVVVGDGPLGEEVRARATGLNNLEAPGWASREELEAHYQSASLVVVPSLWQEVFGLVALEGMAYGKPVLVSDRGGLPDVVADGKTGRVLPAEDREAWEDAIVRLLTDEKKREKMGCAARTRVETVYDPELHVAALERIFQDVQ